MEERKIDASLPTPPLRSLFHAISEIIKKVTPVIWVSMVLLALGMVSIMALKSTVNVHPDEYHSISALEYYKDHWGIADIRDEAASQTYSAYGITCLAERSLYYLIAGNTAFPRIWSARR